MVHEGDIPVNIYLFKQIKFTNLWNVPKSPNLKIQ